LNIAVSTQASGCRAAGLSHHADRSWHNDDAEALQY